MGSIFGHRRDSWKVSESVEEHCAALCAALCSMLLANPPINKFTTKVPATTCYFFHSSAVHSLCTRVYLKRILYGAATCYLPTTYECAGLWIGSLNSVFWKCELLKTWILKKCEFWKNVNFGKMWILEKCEFWKNVNFGKVGILGTCEFWENAEFCKMCGMGL